MRYIIYFLICFATWMLLTDRLYWQNIIMGIVASLITTLIFGRYFLKNYKKFFNPVRYFYLFIYIIFLIWECIKANFDVAYRVLHPAMPVKPGIVKVRLELKSDLARTILANSITMTPGTISVDIVDDYIYVHWIYVFSHDPEDYTWVIAGKFEKLLKKIFE